MTPSGARPDTHHAPIVVVFNVGSGHGNAEQFRVRIETACREAGRPLQLLTVRRRDDVGAIATDAVSRARATGAIVVAAGGDGTINTLAQAALGSGCAFGVLPHGTFNYFSRANGISSDPDEALRQLLTGLPHAVQVGLANDKVFLVNASVGLYPRLLEDRETYTHQYGRSRLVALYAALTTLLRRQRPLRLHVVTDDHERTMVTPTLFVSNNVLQLEQVGIDEVTAIQSGELAAIAIQPMGRLAMAGLLLRGAVSRLGAADQVESFALRSMTIDRASGRRRIKLATDGEVRWMTLPLTFRVSPTPLWLIRPPVAAAPA